ncbi:MAG TPA: MFS transporter [Candidatus Latescibacteria bacterium]|nr:MFS transporter [Candidatus Latescibacterota bacterium]HJP33215.1 MFS transporter [Candidatus Latescibacterota bacterium]
MRGNVLVLTVSGCLGMFSRNMVFPYIPLYILTLGGDPAEIGIVYALGPLGGLLVFPVAGYLADYVSRARLIAFTGYFSSAVILINAVAPSWEWVAAARLLQGFAVTHFPASSAILADSLPPEKRGKGLATMAALSGALALFAPWVAGSMLDTHGVETGMRYLYVAMAIAYALGATINLLFLRETRPPQAEPIRIDNLTQTLRSSYAGIPDLLRGFPTALRAMSIIIILCFIANGIASPFWVVYAKTHIGLSSSQWGLILLVEVALRNLTTIPAGFITDRYGRSPFILGALVATVVIPLFLFAEGFVHVLLIRCAVGVIAAFFSPTMGALLADLVPSSTRGRVMAAIGRGSVMIGGASGGVGGPGTGFLITVPLMLASVAGGLLYEWNPLAPWIVVFAVSLISVATAAFYLRDPEKPER